MELQKRHWRSQLLLDFVYTPYCSFFGHSDQVNSIKFSPSGNLLASSSNDKTVRLWLPNATGDNVVLRGHSGPVRHIDFSPHNQTRDDGSSALLLTCSYDKSIKVWKLPHKRFQRSLLGHANWVQCCKFSPDTPQLAGSCSDDGTVKLWDIDRGSQLTSYKDCPSGVSVIDFMATGTALASGANDGGIRMYDVRTDKMMQYYPGTTMNDGITSLSFHCSGNYLLSSGSNELKIWDIREGRLLHDLNPNKCKDNRIIQNTFDNNSCAIFSSDGKHFASSAFSPENGEHKNTNVLLWETNLQIAIGGINREQSKNKMNPLQRPVSAPFLGLCRSNKDSNIKAFKFEKKQDNPPVNTERGNKNRSRQYTICGLAGDDTYYYKGESYGNEAPENENKQCSYNQKTYERENLPQLLAGTMDYIVGQLDIISQTLAVFNKRLVIQEENMAQIQAERIDKRYLNEEQLLRHRKGDEKMTK